MIIDICYDLWTNITTDKGLTKIINKKKCMVEVRDLTRSFYF